MPKKTKNPLPLTLEERLDLIDKLRADKAQIEEQLHELTGLKKHEVISTPPVGFDYKDTIEAIFNDNFDKILGIDDVVQLISQKHSFTPDRDIVVKQTTLLVDRHGKLERIQGRRGKYRAKSGLPLRNPFVVND